MVDLVTLKRLIKIRGFTFVFVAKSLGITREALYKKLCGKTEFRLSEVRALADLLHLSQRDIMKIFFAK